MKLVFIKSEYDFFYLLKELLELTDPIDILDVAHLIIIKELFDRISDPKKVRPKKHYSVSLKMQEAIIIQKWLVGVQQLFPAHRNEFNIIRKILWAIDKDVITDIKTKLNID